MTALWIVLALLALLTLLNLLRVGVSAGYEAQAFSVSARVGPLTIPVWPRPPAEEPKKPKKEKPPKEPKAPQEQTKEKELDFDTVLALAKLALKAAGSFRRKLTVELFRLVFVAGSSDPYETAMQSAYVQAALGGLRPLAERALHIQERDVQVGADFTADKPRIEARLTLTIRIGQIVAIGVVFGVGYLKLMLQKKKAAKAQTQQNAAETAERKVSNG
ncbi:MAG: DUF2953 domain-containing protein [Clostridiales bacterium]|nr:DUF2953 domain-containing protein [Clostridiales bacterium]MDD6935820.1 DUF2953 domain-containing protein [Clostridiales bacterium]MDY2961661.1 DUF2953 domain-containing protein [Oscillospiraceae bacterium]